MYSPFYVFLKQCIQKLRRNEHNFCYELGVDKQTSQYSWDWCGTYGLKSCTQLHQSSLLKIIYLLLCTYTLGPFLWITNVLVVTIYVATRMKGLFIQHLFHAHNLSTVLIVVPVTTWVVVTLKLMHSATTMMEMHRLPVYICVAVFFNQCSL